MIQVLDSLISGSAERRADAVRVCTLVTVPMLVVFAVIEAILDHPDMVSAVAAGIVVILAAQQLNRVGFKNRWIVRVPLAYFVALCIYYLLRDDSPSSMLYLLLLPFFNSLFLGLREGLVWNGVLGTSSGMLVLPVLEIPLNSVENSQIDYVAAFILATACAYVYQRVKQSGYRAQIAKVSALEQRILELEANAEDDADMVSICAGCKKVKEVGDWGPVEEFLHRRTGVELSHTFCPICADDFVAAFNNRNKP